MKTNHFTFIFALLMIAAGCNSNHNNNKQTEKYVVSIDSTATVMDTTSTPKIKLEQSMRNFYEAKNDVDKLKALMEAVYYAEDIPEKRDKIYKQLAEFTETVPDCERKVIAYIELGTKYQESDISRSFNYYQKALELIKKFPDSGEILKASAYTAMAYTYYLNGDYEQVQKYAFEAIPILEAQQQRDILSPGKFGMNVNNTLLRAYHAVSNMYDIIGQTEKKKEYGKKLIEVAEKCNSPFDLATGYIQNVFIMVRDEPEQSLEYINKAYKIGMDKGYVNIIVNSLDAYSLYEEIKGNIPGAIKYLEKSLEYLRGKQKPDLEMNVYHNLFCLYPNDKQKQLELGIKGLAIADSLKSKLYSSRFNQYLGELYANSGNYKEAYNHYVKYDSLNTAMLNEQSQHQINFLTARFDADRRELEISRQRQIIKSQNLQRTLLAGGVAVSIVFLALLWYMLRLRNRRNHALTERNDALAEMNATKDKFFSIISHDLKNPAIAQRDALQLLIKNAGLWNVDALTDYYQELLKSADGQVELLYNLLNWAQLQTGRMAYTPTTFTLSDLLSDTILIRNMAKNKGITLILPQSQDALITGDRNMLSTVIRNLLTNAIKFTPAGGTVTLNISPCDKGTCPLAYTISITDTGVGMSEEQVHNLFKLDSRQSRRGTAEEQGSGLGLIVCKELLEKHGSELHVESEEGKGSRFEFTIPVNR